MRGPSPQAIVADAVFDGDALLRDHAVVVEGSRIVGVMPRQKLDPGVQVEKLSKGTWLVPGFIDVQVNGGGDMLFNNTPSVESIRTIAVAHRKFGTTSLLPTLITDSREKMKSAAEAVRGAMADNPGVLGIHFEGPFLSSEKPGVHDPAMIRPPDAKDEEIVTSLRNGVTLVTLAPETVPAGFIRRLAESGIRVSLGHSMATYTQTKAAIADGLTGFTHLFNAMAPLASREPGPIGAALENPDVWVGLIVDGHHVEPAVLQLVLRGAARPMLVTDAMPPVGGKNASFKLYNETISVANGRCVRRDGTLAGAALDMATALRNCVELLGMPLEKALPLASANPAAFLGLGDKLGRIAPGYRADLVALDPGKIEVLETWVAGTRSHEHVMA